MVSQLQHDIFNEVVSRGCCYRCGLRFIGEDCELISFEYPETTLVNFGILSTEDDTVPSKKIKTNICCICLGLLQDEVLETFTSHKDVDIANSYKNREFSMWLTFPTCIQLRQHCMKVYLRKKFPEFDDKIIKINMAWCRSIKSTLCKKIKKSFIPNSPLVIHFHTEYNLDDDETGTLKQYMKDTDCEFISKHSLSGLLQTISDEDLEKIITVPPKIPNFHVTLTEIKFTTERICLIGNYLKYSRDLLQVPLIVDDKIVVQESVQDVIITAARTVLGDFEEANFQASSYDEKQWRVLGNGRLFQLQMTNTKCGNITKSLLRKIQELTEKSKKVSINDLKICEKKEANDIIASQTLSSRSVKLLCIIYECKNIDHCVNAINMYSTITIVQRTPIRLIPVRPFTVKQRKIFYIKANKLKDNLIEIDLCSECGLHLPEFVNGDFGRTSPSISEIIRGRAEILAVDIVDFTSVIPCALSEEEVII